MVSSERSRSDPSVKFILSKKPSAEKSSPQMVADQEMLRPKWWQIKKLVRPTYSLLFVRHGRRKRELYYRNTC